MKFGDPDCHRSSFTSDIQCVWTDPEPERGSGLAPPKEVGVTICTILLLGLERRLPLSSWPWSPWPGQFLPGSCLESASKHLQDVTSPLVSTDTSLVSWLVHRAFPFPLIHQIIIYLTTQILSPLYVPDQLKQRWSCLSLCVLVQKPPVTSPALGIHPPSFIVLCYPNHKRYVDRSLTTVGRFFLLQRWDVWSTSLCLGMAASASSPTHKEQQSPPLIYFFNRIYWVETWIFRTYRWGRDLIAHFIVNITIFMNFLFRSLLYLFCCEYLKWITVSHDYVLTNGLCWCHNIENNLSFLGKTHWNFLSRKNNPSPIMVCV